MIKINAPRSLCSARFLSIALLSLTLLPLTTSTYAAVDKTKKHLSPSSNVKDSKKPRWLLKDFIAMASENPTRLLGLGNKLFSDERMRVSSLEASMAFEWQHRLAMVSAISEFFHPQAVKKNSSAIKFQMQARSLITKALLEDPSLLVRDGAVEAIRRIIRMSPKEATQWKKSLEAAFLSERNIMDGEGFFIRETILTAMKEGGLKPSRALTLAANQDLNKEVRALLPLTKKIASSKKSSKKRR